MTHIHIQASRQLVTITKKKSKGADGGTEGGVVFSKPEEGKASVKADNWAVTSLERRGDEPRSQLPASTQALSRGWRRCSGKSEQVWAAGGK